MVFLETLIVNGKYRFKPYNICLPMHNQYEHGFTDSKGKKYPRGVYYHSQTKGTEQTPPVAIDEWICGVLKITAIARDKNARSFGHILQFQNKFNHWHTWNMPTRLLAGRSDELLEELLDMGLAFNYHKRALISSTCAYFFLYSV